MRLIKKLKNIKKKIKKIKGPNAIKKFNLKKLKDKFK